MITIIITGPSGSGKTYLSNKLLKLFDNSIVIKTDSYYRDNILIKFLSIFLCDIYDRPLSINKNELKNTLSAIHNKNKIITYYKYDFKRRQSSHSKKIINYKGDNQFLILEGIFAHRLDLNYQETINIICEERKDICFKRRLIRDKLERNRNTSEVNRKFTRSWNLFYKNIIRYIDINRKISLNPVDKISYGNLVYFLQNISKKNN